MLTSKLAVEVLRCSGAGRSWGSGLVVADGLVLTAAHGARQGALRVRFADGKECPAKLALCGDEELSDLALIRFEGSSQIVPPWRFGAVRREPANWIEGCSAIGFPRFT